jgi:hypothetical protein
MALPVALFAMIASMGLASAAVMVSVDVQQGSKRDTSAKGAIAAADAGANVARLRLNRYSTVLGPTTPCIVVNGAGMLEGTVLLATDGWCPEVTGTVGSATYAYRVSPVGTGCGTYDLCVVSTGTADGVSRRIEVSYESLQPEGDGSSTSQETAQEKKEREERELKEKEEAKDIAGATWSSGIGIDGVIGVDKVTIDNNADARVNVGTNGEVEVFNNGDICGNIRYGVGKKEPYFHNNGKWCSGYTKTQANVELPPVSSFMPADIATNNSNFRLALCTKTKPTKVPTGCQADTYSKSWSSTDPWNLSTRTISTSNNATLTLGGGDYFVCKLMLSNNSHLIMADGAQVRVFFDTPENCGLAPGTKQIDVSNNANITATGYQPSLGQYDLPGFYLMGSPTIPTTVEWSNNSGTNEFVLYGPNSNIELKNNATYYGIIAGKTVHLNNNAVVIQNAGFTLPSILNPWKETISSGGGTEEEKIKKEQEEKELKEKEDKEGNPAPAAIFFSPKAYVECSSLPAAGESPNTSC